MHTILIYSCLIYTVKSAPQHYRSTSERSSPKNDVEVFGSFYEGALGGNPIPMPPLVPYPRPVYYPTSFPRIPIARNPPFYPPTTKRPIVPPFPSYFGNRSVEMWRPRVTERTTQRFTELSTSVSTSTASVMETTVLQKSTNTPVWISPSKPSWPQPSQHLEAPDEIIITGDTVTQNQALITGLLSEYQGYNEKDGSFQLGFALQNGLSASVRGYRKDGKQFLEGSYTLFTEDGKPVKIAYSADDDNHEEVDQTTFRFDIPFESSDNDKSRVINVAKSNDQLSDLILRPIEDEMITTTQKSNES